MSKEPHIKAYSLIKKNRLVRKLKTYKLALSVGIDKTTAIYLIIIGIYVLFSFFILNDFINDYSNSFLYWEERAKENIWQILTILPLGYIIQSFSKPGVVFSSSEYQLSLLPFSRGKIWLFTALEKWLKRLVFLTIIGLLAILVTPISPFIVVIYIIMFTSMNIIMTIPQWKLFQTNVYVKIGFFCVVIIINFLNFISQTYLVSLLFIGVLIGINLILKKRLFYQVKWDRVTEVNDFQLWTMWLVSKVSEVEIKRQRKFSVFKKLSRRKKPFLYSIEKIYQRMWRIYFIRHIQIVLKISGALSLLLFVFLFLNQIIFHIVLAVAIHIYTSVLKSFFIGRFEDDIVQVLPWDLESYKRTFLNWSLYGSVILLIPVSVFLGLNFSAWVPMQLLFLGSTFLYLFNIRINKAITMIRKDFTSYDLVDSIGYLLLIGVAFSWKYKFILCTGIVIPFMIMNQKINLRR